MNYTAAILVCAVAFAGSPAWAAAVVCGQGKTAKAAQESVNQAVKDTTRVVMPALSEPQIGYSVQSGDFVICVTVNQVSPDDAQGK